MSSKKSWWMKKRWYVVIFLVIYFSILTYHQYKPLPEGISYKSEMYQVDDVEFYRDLTYTADQEEVVDQEIFKRIDEMIVEAEDFIVIDIFMMDGRMNEDFGFPEISKNLMNQLITKKQENPEMPIVFITDPVNTGYSSYEGDWLEPMKDVGIEVVMTNLDPLRDPNPLYSTFWRMGLQWFGQEGDGWISNAFVEDGPKMTVRSYLKLANIKANHRKVIITDQSAMVSSANAHDESGFHGNVAFEVDGPIIQEMLNAEQAVINLTENDVTLPSYNETQSSEGNLSVQYTTEGKTWNNIVQTIQEAEDGDELWMAMYYLGERKIVNELTDAGNRGVEIFLVLDPNETAFGKEKTGLPNRPVVNELIEDTNGFIQVRWYNVNVEQFHPKMMFVKSDKEATIVSGSANFTKRNLVSYNNEADLMVSGPVDEEVFLEVDNYFSKIWSNEDGSYTVGVDEFQDEMSFWQRGIYSVQKFLGFTTY